MTQWHGKSVRKPSGGRRRSRRRRDKRLAERGGDFAETKMAAAGAKDRRKIAKARGGNIKAKHLVASKASVADPKTKKVLVAKILSVKENSANRQYARRNVITKGAIIAVEIAGKEVQAKVTSRPGQSGNVQAVLIGQ